MQFRNNLDSTYMAVLLLIELWAINRVRKADGKSSSKNSCGSW